MGQDQVSIPPKKISHAGRTNRQTSGANPYPARGRSTSGLTELKCTASNERVCIVSGTRSMRRCSRLPHMTHSCGTGVPGQVEEFRAISFTLKNGASVTKRISPPHAPAPCSLARGESFVRSVSGKRASRYPPEEGSASSARILENSTFRAIMTAHSPHRADGTCHRPEILPAARDNGCR